MVLSVARAQQPIRRRVRPPLLSPAPDPVAALNVRSKSAFCRSTVAESAIRPSLLCCRCSWPAQRAAAETVRLVLPRILGASCSTERKLDKQLEI